MKQVSMYFKSDFTVILASEAQWGGCPFRIKLWTASPAEGRSITACFDGTVWHNCQLLSDGRLQICVNQGDLGKNQYIGIGTLKMDIEFYLSNDDFNDHICNEHIRTFEPVFVDEDGEEYRLYLGADGASTITTIGTLPAFYQAGLTPEEHQALIDATAHAEDAAQSANTAAENANDKAAIAAESARLANEARQQLTTTFNEKVAELDADYAAKKQALDADYASVKQSLGTDYANTKIALDADYTAKKAALDADYASVKATLSASYSEAIAGINNRMSAIEAQYVTDKAAWQAEVDAIIAKFEQDFATAEAERESRVAAAIALANMAATQAGNVNAVLNGDNLTVTDKNGQSVTRNVRGPKGDSITMFPNVTIFGQPTIQESQISGFTAQNYVQFPFLVDFAGRPWQLDCSITTGADVSQQHNVFDSAFGLAFAFANGKFVLAMSSNGTSWDLGATSGTHNILANTTYYIRISWDGSVYKLAYSTNKETWVDDIVVTSSASLASKQIVIGKSLDNRYIFNGSINMSDAHLTISGKIVWEGMDDAGLATRMAIDLSNIDEEGKARVNEVAMAGEVGQKLGDLSAGVSELEEKTEDVKIESIEGFHQEVRFEKDNGEVIGTINDDGADFITLKKKGDEVATKNDLDYKANKSDMSKELKKKQDVIAGISNEHYEGGDEAVVILDDEGNEVHRISEDEANFKNLNSNGKRVVTEDEIENISKAQTKEDGEWVIFETSSGNEVIKFTEKGICSVGYFDVDGNPIGLSFEHEAINGETIESIVNGEKPFSIDRLEENVTTFSTGKKYIFTSEFYAPAGNRKCKLVISCPGGGILPSSWYNYPHNTLDGATSRHGEILTKLGYAVLIIQGWCTELAQDLGYGDSMQPYCNWMAVEEARKAYEYITSKYNWIDTNGVYLYGESQGGGMAENIAELSGIPIAATVLDVPMISLQPTFTKSDYLKTCINRLYNIGETWDAGKCLGCDPMTRNMSEIIDMVAIELPEKETMPDGSKQRVFDYVSVTAKKYRATSSPLLLLASKNDNVLSPTMQKVYAKACMNAGQPIMFKRYDCWSEASKSGHGVIQFTTKVGSINGMACSHGLVEVLDFFRRCGGYDFNLITI